MFSDEKNDSSATGDPGKPIQNKDRRFTPAKADEKLVNAIHDHVEKHVGKIDSVWHDIISDVIHVDIYHIKPNARFDFHVLVTCGMSSNPMNTPKKIEGDEYAELLVLLPPDWKLGPEDFKNEEYYWPVRQLIMLARYPHEHKKWFSYGHTMPNGYPPQPFAANTTMNAILLFPSISMGSDFFSLSMDDRKTVNFYSLVPLYQEEVDFQQKRGTDALIDKFEREGISDVIDIGRKNTCLKKFGLF